MKGNSKKYILDILINILGNVIFAFGVCAFMTPRGIIMGGATGIAIALSRLTNIKLYILIYILNIFFFILGTYFLGKKFALGTLFSTMLYPMLIGIFQTIPWIANITNNDLLATIYGGVFIGLGVGLVFRTGSSTGGMDVPPLIINKKTGISIGILVTIFDIMILTSQLSYSSVEQILYGILAVVVSTTVLDKVMILGERKIQVLIISPKSDEIREVVFNKIDRGCTFLNVTTGFKKENQHAVLTIVSAREQFQLNTLVTEIDPTAFIISSDVHSVHGRGFTLPNIDL